MFDYFKSWYALSASNETQQSYVLKPV